MSTYLWENKFAILPVCLCKNFISSDGVCCLLMYIFNNGELTIKIVLDVYYLNTQEYEAAKQTSVTESVPIIEINCQYK